MDYSGVGCVGLHVFVSEMSYYVVYVSVGGL